MIEWRGGGAVKRGRGVRREGTEKVAGFFFPSYHTYESMVVKNHKKKGFPVDWESGFPFSYGTGLVFFYFKVTHSSKIRMLDSLKLYLLTLSQYSSSGI